MRKKIFIAAGLIMISGLAAISGKYLVDKFDNRIKFSRVPTFEQNKMEGVSIKKHIGSANVVISAAILKPRAIIPTGFVSMILSDDSEYTVRLRDVRVCLTDKAKKLVVEGPEAVANARFTALTIRSRGVLSNNGYAVNPNSQYIHIKLTGNKVEVTGNG